MQKIDNNINLKDNIDYTNLEIVKGLSSYKGSLQIVNTDEDYLLVNRLYFTNYNISDLPKWLNLFQNIEYKNYLSEYKIALKDYRNTLYSISLNNNINKDYYKFISSSTSDISKLTYNLNNFPISTSLYEECYKYQNIENTEYISKFLKILYNATEILDNNISYYNIFSNPTYYNFFLSNNGKIIIESLSNLEIIPNKLARFNNDYSNKQYTQIDYSNFDNCKIKVNGNLETENIKSNNITILGRQENPNVVKPTISFRDITNEEYCLNQYYDSQFNCLSFEVIKISNNVNN